MNFTDIDVNILWTGERSCGMDLRLTQGGHGAGPYFSDRFDADGLFYVFDEVAGGSEVQGPFADREAAAQAAERMNADWAKVTAPGFFAAGSDHE